MPGKKHRGVPKKYAQAPKKPSGLRTSRNQWRKNNRKRLQTQKAPKNPLLLKETRDGQRLSEVLHSSPKASNGPQISGKVKQSQKHQVFCRENIRLSAVAGVLSGSSSAANSKPTTPRSSTAPSKSTANPTYVPDSSRKDDSMSFETCENSIMAPMVTSTTPSSTAISTAISTAASTSDQIMAVPKSKGASGASIKGVDAKNSTSNEPNQLQGNKLYSLSQIEQILDVIEPGSFLGLDIDETLIISKGTPSVLLTPLGIRAYQAKVSEDMNYADYAERNRMTRELQKALKNKELVEKRTAEVIRTLQKRGVYVFGVTARYFEMANSTRRCLNSLGIDLSLSSPFPAQSTQDTETEALYAHGIIYCNGMDKGMILNRFLTNLLWGHVNYANQLKKGNDQKIQPPKTPLPSCLYFVDDRYEHIVCILDPARLPILHSLKIPVRAFLYSPPSRREQSLHTKLRSRLLNKQIEIFMRDRIVLSNEETIKYLTVENREKPVAWSEL
jgi:hypothetical protein